MTSPVSSLKDKLQETKAIWQIAGVWSAIISKEVTLMFLCFREALVKLCFREH